jgi:hypothetical protein
MPDMQDRKVWKVWDREVWPPEDYDAIYKIAQKNRYYFNDVGNESLAAFWADEFLNQAYE